MINAFKSFLNKISLQRIFKNKTGGKLGTRISVYAGIGIGDGEFYVVIMNGRKILFNQRLETGKSDINNKIFSWLHKYSIDNYVKIISAGIVGGDDIDKLTADIWLKEDIAPYVFKIEGKDLEKKAMSAAIEVAKNFDNENIIDIKFDPQRKVRTAQLARLEDFKKTVSRKDASLLIKLAKKFKDQGGHLDFFSSTPRGGGVALMRHALIRLYRLLEIDVHWHVMSSKKDTFLITKKKFHNIFQGIAPLDARLTQEDKKILEEWTQKNAKRFFGVFKEAKVIVIDDPQPSGMIPYIKEANPEAKIIYRSHIQMETGLIEERGTPQNEIWNFLWNNIKNADVFISHPIKRFVPHNVPREKVVLMSAVTDRLDGLNKELDKKHQQYYIDIFNSILKENDQSPLDPERPYIIQVARFDPSKGIPDVLESYKGLREKMESKTKRIKKIPQLVIVGHGAIDDPEGWIIYSETMKTLKKEDFRKIARDIKVAIIPHSDQILNALLRGSAIALQLSHREGFEIKVSEALDKGKPVIAYRAGGISLQIEDKITGYLIKVGDTGRVAKLLYELLNDRGKYLQMSSSAKEKVQQDYFTVSNAIKWLFQATQLREKGSIKGNARRVRDIMKAELNSKK